MAIGTLLVISVVSFAFIQLPPGDFVTAYVQDREGMGDVVSADEEEQLRDMFGLNQPFLVQYCKWMLRMAGGDFGFSMEYRRPVGEVIGDRLWFTVVVASAAVVLSGWWRCRSTSSRPPPVLVRRLPVHLPRLHRTGDPQLPARVGADVLRVPLSRRQRHQAVSPEYVTAPWSLAKVVDLLGHLWVPAIVLGTAGTATLIRISLLY